MNKIRKIIYYFQIVIFYIFYFIFKVLKVKNEFKWVIGVDEIASNIYFYGNILDNSITVSLRKNKFYELKYDYFVDIPNKYLSFLYRIIYGPILFGYLIHKVDNFFYIWHTGFLLDREFEFKFLKLKGKKIVCRFVGDDIRSSKLTKEDIKKKNIDCEINYRNILDDMKYDTEKRKTANIADKYADIIFSHNESQISYLKKDVYKSRIPYNKFNFNTIKFKNTDKIKIVHAPSNPIFKATPLVRAAIKKIELEGYKFEYIELQNMPNEVVLNHLNTAHILLNQFYCVAPGLLGVEGMAYGCCVLQSAKFYTEPENDAWLQTRYWEIYDKLKYLLDNPEKIEFYAKNGYEFVKKYHTNEAVKKQLYKIFEENDIL